MGRWQSKNEKGKNSHGWKGGEIKRICKTCQKVFHVKPCLIKSGRGLFCSYRCMGIYRMKHFPKANTSIERKVVKWLNELNIPFKQQALVEGICRPDFLLADKRIIECQGDYCHSFPKAKTRDAKKRLLLGFKGYIILELWEHDINNHPKKCINRIKRLAPLTVLKEIKGRFVGI